MKIASLISLIAALGLATISAAQSQTPQEFVSSAAQDGMTEVELGKLASAKAQSPEVRKFADRMVKDHGKANAELATLAMAKGLNVPKKIDAEHQSMIDKLSAKSGAEFDSSYAQHMVADHRKAIELFEAAAQINNQDIATFAKKTLPTLREHKQMADSLSATGKH